MGLARGAQREDEGWGLGVRLLAVMRLETRPCREFCGTDCLVPTALVIFRSSTTLLCPLGQFVYCRPQPERASESRERIN